MTQPATQRVFDVGVTLACRGDGARAEKTINSIRLIGGGGQVVPSSETLASFDYINTEASWSPSGEQLALFGNGGRIGVWTPSSASLQWLDPDGWVATAYAWSPSRQMLAFAGNTEHQLNVTVEVALAASPTSRKVLYRAGRPIRSMAFSPDEKRLVALDDQGTLTIIDVDGAGSLEHGRHVGARSVRWIQHVILTSSLNELRVWSGDELPREKWVYRSLTNTKLDQCAAADTAWRWQAVSVTAISGTAFNHEVMVRDLKNGTNRNLEVSSSFCRRILFVRNGDWLVFVGLRATYFWSTNTWRQFVIPLQEDDVQYLDAQEEAGRLYLNALGANHLHNENNILYEVELEPTSGPRLLLRRRIDKFRDDQCVAAPAEATAGWRDALDRAKYQSAGRKHCPGSQWEVRIWCRDEPLGASDCDIEFVPVDLQRAMEVYDNLIWHPESAVSDGAPPN